MRSGRTFLYAFTALVVLLWLCSCSSVKTNAEPYVLKGPEDPSVYLSGYRMTNVFYGNELTLGFPGLEHIPVVGSIFGDLIRFRAGASRPVFIPMYEEKSYASPSSFGAPGRPVRVPWGVHQ